jgi:hypothetical protein
MIWYFDIGRLWPRRPTTYLRATMRAVWSSTRRWQARSTHTTTRHWRCPWTLPWSSAHPGNSPMAHWDPNSPLRPSTHSRGLTKTSMMLVSSCNILGIFIKSQNIFESWLKKNKVVALINIFNCNISHVYQNINGAIILVCRRRRKQRVCQLWRQQHAAVAQGRHRPLPVQCVRPLHQNQRHEQATGAAAAEKVRGKDKQ